MKKSKQEALAILTQGFATLEQGLRLFDEVAQSTLTIITEGNNAKLIAKALELHGITDVEVLTDIEGISGKNQLRTIFQFFSKARHENKVLVVWDCDVGFDLSEENNTFPFIIAKNDENKFLEKGIENAFPSRLFSGFTKTITMSNGNIIEEFDENRKRDFEEFVIARNDISDFVNFTALIDEINRVRQL